MALSLSGRRVFAGTVHDITERKLAEQTLKEREEQFRTIADAIPQMMWTTKADGSANYCNARWNDYTGLSVEQTSGGGWMAAIHPEDVETLKTAWSRCLENGSPYDGESRIKRASDGTYLWFLIRGVAVRDASGTIKQWIGTCTDIDDQKRSLEIEAARMEAETANRAKSEFLANMSHEIRTPMTAILGYADLLLDADQTPSDRDNAVNVIRRNGAHLLTVINDILDLSKIEAGELKIERLPCSPCQILAEVTSTMRVRAVEKGLKFELKIEGLIPQTIVTDVTRLRQILINLIGNAVKFTAAGWVRVVAKLVDRPDSPNPHMRFEVVDSGIGMTPRQLSKLFQPFVQADNSTTRRFGGTGLGLTISRRLVMALGGEITVDSTADRGSLFAVTIETGPLAEVPMIRDCTESIKGDEHPATPTVSEPVLLSGRILLAEDGPDNQALLSTYLRKSGAEVVAAENGRIAVEKVAESMQMPGQHGFDLILMDMQMPELDGYGATAQLRRMGYKGPIVALTAHAMATDRDRCLQVGCSDYLSKPVKRDDLLKAVSRNLVAAQQAMTSSEAVPQSAASPSAIEGDDEILNQYRPKFIASLRQEVDNLLACLTEQKIQELAQVAHKLAGTAGMYEFMGISKASALVEEKIRRGGTINTIESNVHTLVELIRSVEGYDATGENKNR